jgi:hypothetical protein
MLILLAIWVACIYALPSGSSVSDSLAHISRRNWNKGRIAAAAVSSKILADNREVIRESISSCRIPSSEMMKGSLSELSQQYYNLKRLEDCKLTMSTELPTEDSVFADRFGANNHAFKRDTLEVVESSVKSHSPHELDSDRHEISIRKMLRFDLYVSLSNEIGSAESSWKQ